MIIKSGTFKLLLLFLLPAGLLINSCEKEVLLEDPSARLVFSSDTVHFDTIFTTIGSATRHFKVFNPFDRSIEISEITLSGGSRSPFRINVDGISGRQFSDIVIRAGDSLFIFVEATIDPVEGSLPVIVEDSIVFCTNGNIQDVKLVAWGQDVKIINGEIFGSGTLTAGKPYLVYNYILIDSGQVLNIEPGVRIHFNRNSRFIVAGSVIAEGTYEEPIVFEGARTEPAYRNIPGQWEGIWLMPGSEGNRFVNTRIRNAISGIIADSVAGTQGTTLYLANTWIENMTYSGLLARGAVVYSYNTVISDCGYHSLVIASGGDYMFYHCTFANYWNFSSRTTPSVVIDNYHIDSTGNIMQRPVRAFFGNTIIHGSRNQELAFSIHPDSGFEIRFSHSLIGIRNSFSSAFPEMFENCLIEISPAFIDPMANNFRLDANSPAANAGDRDIGALHPFDFEGTNRTTGIAPDIGAFETDDD